MKSRIYDQTYDFQGDGPGVWSNKFAQLIMTTWNTRSLSNDRFSFCKNLGFDVLAITELWRSANNYTDGSVSFIPSKPVKKPDGNVMFPDDPASGVGIFLSETAQQMLRHRIRLRIFHPTTAAAAAVEVVEVVMEV